MYDADGNWQFDLPDFKSESWCDNEGIFVGIGGDLAIVPRPGSHNEFYVIYIKNFDYGSASLGTANPRVFYVTVKINASNDPELTGLTTSSCDGGGPTFPAPHLIKHFINERETTAFTVSKPINAKNERYLFVCGVSSSGGGTLTRFHINNAGISLPTVILTAGTYSGTTVNGCDFNTHKLVLSPDQHFLSWCGDWDHAACPGSDRNIFVLPLLNYAPYPSYSLTQQIHKVTNATEVGGMCFSADSRYLLYTTTAGLKYALINDANPVSLPTPSTVSGTTDLHNSDVALGQNRHVFAVDESTETLTHFAWPTTTAITSSIPNKGNHSNNYNDFYRLPKEYCYDFRPLEVAIDINTKCVPGTVSPIVYPVFTVTATGGTGTYQYNWYPLPGNTAVLSNYHTATPQISSSTGSPHRAYFYLTITDMVDNTVTPKGMFVDMKLIASSDWDLAGKDSPWDLYDEPNTQTEVNPDHWQIDTRDIWNRVGTDGMTVQENEDPKYVAAGPVPNNIYVRIRNVGCVESPSTGRNAHVYWTAGGGPETWSNVPGANYWVDKTYTPWGGGVVAHGQQMCTLPIPAIAPGDFTILTGTWVPPNPTLYQPTAVPVTSVQICFLTRILDGHNPSDTYAGMTIPELFTGTITANVKNNNNIVSLNAGMMVVLGKRPDGTGTGYTGVPPKVHVLTLANAQNTPTKFTLQLGNHHVLSNTGASTLSDYVRVKVRLGDVYTSWVNAGRQGNVVEYDDAERSVTFDGSTTMQLDSVELDTAVIYPITIETYLLDNASGANMPNETIYFRQMLNGETYGWYTFHLKYEPQDAPKGILAVTEISAGPSTHPGCDYAEIIVGNCDGDASTYVDIDGWVIDDNSGTFSQDVCDADYGFTEGHYKLSGNIWKYVPVGSILMVYNEAENCYGFPSSFTVDEENHVYWIPVHASSPNGYVLTQFDGGQNQDACSYCAEQGTTSYAPAHDWSSIIALKAASDGIQVRCPGCTQQYAGIPAFYHGVGYTDATGDMVTVSPGTYSLGGPVVEYGTATFQKYMIDPNATFAEIGDPAYWDMAAADAAGNPPASAGAVAQALRWQVMTHAITAPCCNYQQQQGKGVGGGSPSAQTGDETKSIRVYPNPANTQVFFEFPTARHARLEITEVTGRTMESRMATDNNKLAVDVSKFTPGIYLYHLTVDGKVKTGKIVVK